MANTIHPAFQQMYIGEVEGDKERTFGILAYDVGEFYELIPQAYTHMSWIPTTAVIKYAPSMRWLCEA